MTDADVSAMTFAICLLADKPGAILLYQASLNQQLMAIFGLDKAICIQWQSSDAFKVAAGYPALHACLVRDSDMPTCARRHHVNVWNQNIH